MTLRLVQLANEAELSEWRHEARLLMQSNISPDGVVWEVRSSNSTPDFFAEPAEVGGVGGQVGLSFGVPRAFLELAEQVVCHSTPDRFDLLYRLLWRLKSNNTILDDPGDEEVQRANALAKAVRRDKHKMTAFVRFREVITHGESVWISWFEPQHHIVKAAAPFFVRRFSSMKWSILTPSVSAHWDGADLTFSAGASRSDTPAEDALEGHWRTYFSAIFNPARLNVSAMQREMPKRYWKNLPESTLIPDLIHSASQRTREMIENSPGEPRVTTAAREVVMHRKTQSAQPEEHPPQDLSELTEALTTCRRCPLWRDATQAVPGEGSGKHGIMIVGEQPGDQEDLKGEPFVGPAGKLLNGALEAAGIDRRRVYITNAVKHFKFEPRGKRRLHKKPNAAEIDVCRWWLHNEIRLVAPKLIIALGATAATSLLQRPIKVGAERGKPNSLVDGTTVYVTVHPSYLLRLPDANIAAVEHKNFVSDLKSAAARFATLP